jgi:hypothetical protein
MKNLKNLYAGGNCGIDQCGIRGLDLNELFACFNFKITNVSFMKNLKCSYVESDCYRGGLDSNQKYNHNERPSVIFLNNIKQLYIDSICGIN